MNSHLKDRDALFYLKLVLDRTQEDLPELRNWVESLKSEQLDIDYELYDEVRNHIGQMIWNVIHAIEGLKEISNNIDMPVPGPIAGAALKPRLDLSPSIKDEIARIVLVCAGQILRSDFDTVSFLSQEISDICEEHIRKSAEGS